MLRGVSQVARPPPAVSPRARVCRARLRPQLNTSPCDGEAGPSPALSRNRRSPYGDESGHRHGLHHPSDLSRQQAERRFPVLRAVRRGQTMATPSPVADVPARPAPVGGPDAVDARASRVVLSHVMGHQDTNLYGSVHGGAVMRLIDEAAAAAAGRHAGMPAVTVAVDGTSMRVQVVVPAERCNDLGPVVMVATAELVFVAVEHQGNPQGVPPFVAGDLEWLYETTTEPHPNHTFVPAEIGQRPRRRRDAEASPSTLGDF